MALIDEIKKLNDETLIKVLRSEDIYNQRLTQNNRHAYELALEPILKKTKGILILKQEKNSKVFFKLIFFCILIASFGIIYMKFFQANNHVIANYGSLMMGVKVSFIKGNQSFSDLFQNNSFVTEKCTVDIESIINEVCL
jgi:hypothetical protein